LLDLAPHLHQQIVFPLMAAALVVAVAATAVGVTEMSKIIGKWIDGNIRQTVTTVSARFEDVRRQQAADAAMLAQDDRLHDAMTSKGRVVPDSVAVTRFLVAVKQAAAHDNLMLLDREGVVVASTGVLHIPAGTTVLSKRHTKWTGLAMALTTFIRLKDRETLTSFGRYDANGDYTLVVSDIVDSAFLARALRGLGSGFTYFDADGRFIASYVDRDSVGAKAASALEARLTDKDPELAAEALTRGHSFTDITVGGERYRMFGRSIRFSTENDPTEGTAHIVAVVSTSVQEQAGATTMRLIGFWSVLAVFVLTAFGLFVARRVSLPLTDLSDVAKRVAEGDFGQKVDAGGSSNEIADLGRSFNLMTESLKQRTESITKKVLELATLYEMSRALGSTLELEVLLDSVLDSALRIFNVESGYIVLRDRDTEQLLLKAWRGMAGGRPDERALRSSMCEWVCREGRPLIYNPPAEGETSGGQIDNITGATAALCVPLISNEGIIGAVTVGSRDTAFRFTSDDVRLLSTIANHATIAVGNIELFSSLQEAYIATVRALAAAVDAKDTFTRGHSDRVAMYTMAIAEKLDLSIEQRTALEMAAYLHDIGKIGIREEILLKPGRLTDAEMAQMRHHPLIGANILKPVAFPWAIAPVVRHHHEHWDGKGYPAGLRGEEIPLLARILGVADSYEAMTSDRPYRPGRTAEEGIAELKRCAGTQFDPRVVEAFVGVLKGMERDREAIGAHVPEDVQTDEARAIFVAVCDGMLASFRRLGGPRLSSNLESELNRFFTSEQLPFTFAGGRLTAKWNGSAGRESELSDMRRALMALAGGMAQTSGGSLVDGFYTDALGGLSTRMRMLAETMQLYCKA
jgi:putative nucleotidyltransferase with HDIG domain